MENEIENIDSPNDEIENIDSPNGEGADEGEAKEQDFKALFEAEKKKNAKLFERLKKGDSKPEPAKKPQSTQPLSREEARLIALGHTDDDIEDIKFISDRFNIPLMEASKDKRFISLKNEREAEAKSQAAAVRASGGSKAKEATTFDTAKERDDHRALFNKEIGR